MLSFIKKNGRLLIEEFDVEAVDILTTNWYYEKLHQFCGEPSVQNSMEQWLEDHEHHDHPLNTGHQMITAIEQQFEIIQKSKNPYLFRSIGARLPFNQSGYEQTKALIREESDLIKEAKILATGLRIIAVKK